MKEAMMGWACG